MDTFGRRVSFPRPASPRRDGKRLGKIIAIVGPTAVGKSALALALAESRAFGSTRPVEIVSADSRQVYRDLDHGTAKPTADEQRRVRHHVLDVVDPEDDFSLAEFQDRAYLAIDDILRRDGIPLLVGGTGLYVRAVLAGFQLPRVEPDPAFRRELEEFARTIGGSALHARLATVDPVAASRIDPRNVRRVIRALEVVEKTGGLFSAVTAPSPRYDYITLGLTTDRGELYRRIDERVERQIAGGLVEETRRVLERGCPATRPALGGFGYRQIVDHLAGAIDLPTAVERYKFETHRFARQQYTWFRLDDASIQWLAAGQAVTDEATAVIQGFLRHAPNGPNEGRR